MKKGTTLASVLCKLKQKTEKEDKKDVDYIINWKLRKMKYIGETGQQFQASEKQSFNKWDLQPLKTQQETPD